MVVNEEFKRFILDIIAKYEDAAVSNIYEMSSNIDKDMRILSEEIAELKKKTDEFLNTTT